MFTSIFQGHVMNTFLTTLLLTSFITLITACSSSEDVKPIVISTHTSMPSWYTDPDMSNKSYIYGLGQGDSRKDAINSALNDSVSTLNVSVSSSFERSISSSNNNGTEFYDTNTQESINVVTEELSLNNYEVVEQKRLDKGTHVVMIRVNKHKLFQSLYADLENSFKMLDATLQSKADTLEMILIYRKYLGIIKQHMASLGILHTLNPAFDDEAFKQQYKEVLNTHNKLIENKVFKLEINDPYDTYTSTIKKGLMGDGVKVTTDNIYDYVVRVNVKETSEIKVRRHVINLLSVTFTVGIGDNSTKKDIYYTTFKLQSESDESIEKARTYILEALEQKIDHSDIFNIPTH